MRIEKNAPLPEDVVKPIGRPHGSKNTYAQSTTNVRTIVDGDREYAVWATPSDCILDDCRASLVCPYIETARKGVLTRCYIQARYLDVCEKTIVRNFGKLMTEDELFRMGMHLIPLYKTLVKLKIVEMGVRDIIEVSDRGKISIHPVLKEIRETIRAIESVWSELGMKHGNKAMPPLGKDGKIRDAQSYYGRMEADAHNEFKRRRAKLRSIKR